MANRIPDVYIGKHLRLDSPAIHFAAHHIVPLAKYWTHIQLHLQ